MDLQIIKSKTIRSVKTTKSINNYQRGSLLIKCRDSSTKSPDQTLPGDQRFNFVRLWDNFYVNRATNSGLIFRSNSKQNWQNNLTSLVCQQTGRGESMQKRSTFQSYFHFSSATSFQAVTCEHNSTLKINIYKISRQKKKAQKT